MGQRVRTSEKILCTRGNNIVAFSCYVRILEYFTKININIVISRHHQQSKTKQVFFFYQNMFAPNGYVYYTHLLSFYIKYVYIFNSIRHKLFRANYQHSRVRATLL